MKSKHLSLFLTVFAFLVIFTNCKNKTKNSETSINDSLVLNQIDIPEPDTANIVDGSALSAQSVSGYGAKHWRRIFKHCMNSILITKKDADYLGQSNSLTVGTIMDSTRDNTIFILDSIFTPEEIQFVKKEDGETTCNYSVETKLNISALFNADIDVKGTNDGVAAMLKTELKKEKKVSFKVDKWQKVELITGNLNMALKTNPTDLKNEYKKQLVLDGNIILNRVIKIKGFSATINLNTDINVDLQAKLKEGVIANFSSAKGDISVKLVNNKTLEMSSGSDIIMFGKFSVGELIVH